jgi:DNA invertase Pin-like site-specific DNA recombinase
MAVDEFADHREDARADRLRQVSTEDQHLDLQRDALTRASCARTFEDRRSGAKADRPGLAAALDYVWSGDSLVVWRLDRLGRSLSDLIALVRRMEEAGVQLRSLTEGIDTSTTNGKLTFHLFAALAEFERALVRERTRAGLDAARARGRMAGASTGSRPSDAPTPSRFIKPKTRPSAICRLMGISKPTLYAYVAKAGARP